MIAPLTDIIIHCSATHPRWLAGRPLADKVAEIKRWHVHERGWSTIGYHWIIDRDGSIAPGRAETITGAHTQGRNQGSIGICLLGGQGANAHDAFGDHFTQAQDAALRELIEQIKARHPHIKRISGHNDHAARGCPGFQVGRWLAYKGERKLTESRTLLGQVAVASGTVLSVAAEALPPALPVAEAVTAAQTPAPPPSVEPLAATITQAAQAVEPLVSWSNALQGLFLILTLAGVALTVYARLDDWKRGRR